MVLKSEQSWTSVSPEVGATSANYPQRWTYIMVTPQEKAEKTGQEPVRLEINLTITPGSDQTTLTYFQLCT